MPSQRPFFLSTVFSAFRQQTAAPSLASTSQQSSKQNSSSSYSTAATTAAAAAAARSVQQQPTAAGASPASQYSPTASTTSSSGTGGGGATYPAQPQSSPSGASTIPIPCPGRRRGSDSSTEGFRNVRGADKWYVGGRTATGEERFFKLGVIRRVRSNDRLSLDRLSL